MVGYWQDRAQRQQKSVVIEAFSLNLPFPSLASHFQGYLEQGLMPGLRGGQNLCWSHREWGMGAEEEVGWHLELPVLYTVLTMEHIPSLWVSRFSSSHSSWSYLFYPFPIKCIHEKKATEKPDMRNYLKRWFTKSPETPQIRSVIPLFKHWLRTH